MDESTTLQNIMKDDAVRCAELEAAIQVVEILTALPQLGQSPQDLLKLLKDKDSYLDELKFEPNNRIKHVMLSSRPKGKDLSESLSPEYLDKLTHLGTSDHARQFLKEELDKSGLTLEMIDYKPPISHDMRHIIRIEFSGNISKPDEDFLSDTYLDLSENPASTQTRPDDYNLEENFSWQTFKKFPNFRNMEKDFKNALTLFKVPPEKVKDLNSFDFEALLFEYKSHGDEGITHIHIFEGAKESAVKIHTRNHRSELEAYFKALGADDQEAAKVLDLMERKGITPALTLPNGDSITADVHHDTAILDAGLLDDPTMVNDPSNFRTIFHYNTKDGEDIQFATLAKDKTILLAAKEHHIDVDENVDLFTLSSSSEAKQDFIKNLAQNKESDLKRAFEDMEVSGDTIKTTLETMKKTGEIPPLPLKHNRELVLDLKKTKRGLKVVFGMQEKDARYTNVHQGIFHGLRMRPEHFDVSETGEPLQTHLIHAEGDAPPHKMESERSAYTIEAEKEDPANRIKKMFLRIRMKLGKDNPVEKTKSYPIFILGGLHKKLVIWSTSKDVDDVARRQKRLENNQQYSTRNYSYGRK